MAEMRNGRPRRGSVDATKDAAPMPCRNSSQRNYVSIVRIIQSPDVIISSSPDYSPP